MSWRVAPLTASTLAARSGQLHNTLIIYVRGDNGASAEGGLNGTLNEWADNTASMKRPRRCRSGSTAVIAITTATAARNPGAAFPKRPLSSCAATENR